MSDIILASQSPQRKIILQTLGIKFLVKPADIDEKAVAYSTLRQRAANIALAKAWWVQQKYPDDIIIAADTYSVCRRRILEKPQTKKEAIEMLQFLSGQNFVNHSGWAYLDKKNQLEKYGVAVSRVKFRDLSIKEIKNYVQNNPVTTWSAAFCPAYHEGMSLIAKFSGSLTAFTHGLPLEIIAENLRKSELGTILSGKWKGDCESRSKH